MKRVFTPEDVEKLFSDMKLNSSDQTLWAQPDRLLREIKYFKTKNLSIVHHIALSITSVFAEYRANSSLTARQIEEIISNLDQLAEIGRKKMESSGPEPTTFKVWELFGFILSHKTRERIFVPAFNDFKVDFLETRKKKYRGKWAQRWLMFCFWFRFLFLVLECIRVGLQSAVVKFLLWLVSPIGDVIKFMIRRE